MDDLKKYISEHRGEFDSPSMSLPSMSLPSGSKERFMAKVKRRRIGRVLYACACSAAAVLAFVAVLKYETDENFKVVRMMREIADHEAEIMLMVERHNPQDAGAASSTIRAITAEAIPMATLLPEELPSKERMRILKEYYGQKIEALERVKSSYLDINEF